MDQFPGFAVILKTARVTPRLMIEHDDFSTTTNLFEIPEALALADDGTAIHSHPKAFRTAGVLSNAIIQIPQFEPPFIVPGNPLAIEWVIPVLLTRNLLAGALAKFALAIHTKAWATTTKPAPTIVSEPFRMIALSDFAQDSRNVFLVIRTVHAGNE
jgi:hypothetical protein